MDSKIVDISGLAKVLLCSESILLKTWQQIPHFFIGLGGTARGARFDVDDVISYYKRRDYAITGQKNKIMDRISSEGRVPEKNKKGIQDKDNSERMGKNNIIMLNESGGNKFDVLRNLRKISPMV